MSFSDILTDWAIGGVPGAFAGYEARKANERVREYEEEVRRQEALQRRVATAQAEQQAEARREARLAEAQQIRSQIQAAAAESGVSVGGTYEAMMRQVTTDAEGNLENIMRSLVNELQGIRLDRTIFQDQYRNPELEALKALVQSAGQAAGLAGGVGGPA
jgi:hypothetical protein